MSGRPNAFTVVEMLVVVVLTTVLLAALLGSVAAGGRALRRTVAHSEQLDAARIARIMVSRIAASGGIVGPAERAGEVRVHLPIGWAEACDSAFTWRGIRLPDEDRDSAIVVDSLSRIHRVAVRASVARDCAGPLPIAGSTRSIETLPAVSGAMLIRVFESGVVRVDDAVRYARLGTARQPLTAAVLDPSASGVGVGDAVLRVVVAGSTLRWEGTWIGR